MNTLLDIAMQHAETLIAQARSGDEAAFNKLVQLWYKRIYNMANKYFSDHDIAMEVTQRTFIAVHSRLNQLRDTTSFKPWLYRIAINQCHDEDRKLKARNLTSIDDSETVAYMEVSMRQANDVASQPEKKLLQKELKAQVSTCLQLLNVEQKEVVIMKEYEGLKFREIAEALDISENTAKSRLYYGLRTMRKHLIEAHVNLEHYNYD